MHGGGSKAQDQEVGRELRTLAECLDALGEGDLPALGDLLMQRFKSKEHEVLSGHKDLCSHIELIPPPEGGLLTQEERVYAAKAQLQEAKIHEARRKAKGLG